MLRFSLLNFNENGTGCIRDQHCHLQGDRASLESSADDFYDLYDFFGSHPLISLVGVHSRWMRNVPYSQDA